MKTIFALISLVMVAGAAEPDAPTPIGHVVEGVYFAKSKLQTTILELKDGKYRIWFSSDLKTFGEITLYPLTGTYMTNGGEVTVIYTSTYAWNFTVGSPPQTNHFPMTNRWTFMKFKGQTTLWRPEGVTYWEQTKKTSSYAVLFPAQEKPEEIWRGR